MNIGEVMRLKPTMLIGSVPFTPDTVAKILAEPVTFVAINPRSLADIERDIRTLGRIANRPANAETLIVKMKHRSLPWPKLLALSERIAGLVSIARPGRNRESVPHLG